MNDCSGAYSVDVAWPVGCSEDVDGMFRALLNMQGHVFHGAHEPWPQIKSSLDLLLEGHPPSRGHDLEKVLLRQFGEQSFRHLQPGARWHIETASAY